jgi:aminopeptidase N
MTKLRRFAFPVASALFLTACNQDRGSRDYDVQRYDLDAEYDWKTRRLLGSVRITLSPGRDALANIDLDSSVDVKSVRLDGIGEVDYEVQPEKHLWVSLEDLDVKKDSPVVMVIDYEAASSDNLRALGARNGDPIDIRAVYTDSEPAGVRQWMPSKDDPADRAIFAAGLRMDPRETLIANGSLMADKTSGSSRYMRYETAYPLPTYLMAFAISEFDVHSTKQGKTPVEVWHRKGLPGDHETMASELGRMIGEMEQLFVPYPFERYALVLLPGHMVGGMENAGISFQRETSTTAPALAGDLQLAAHELAHQWFGDLMTVESWDDVWIKEGMATLLEEELVRSHLDANNAGTLHGQAYFVADGEAIRDPSKAPLDKYDSGPYGRSAWFFTQIRKVVGDETFFGTMRQLLITHRMGNVSSEDVVQAFAPAFEPNGADKLRRALAAKSLPQIVFSDVEQTATLIDPEGALIAPMEYEWVAIEGTKFRKPLLRGELNAVQSANDTDLLVLDPDDVHPQWEFFTEDEALPEFITSRRVPTTSEQLESFFTLSGVHQQAALSLERETVWPLEPTTLPTFLSRLHSDGAQAVALERACAAALGTPSPQWNDAIRSAFTTYPTYFGLSAIGSYPSCVEVLGEPQPWDDEWQKLATGLPNGDISAERLTFLTRFDANHRDVWAGVLDNAGSLRARQIAAGRIPASLENHAFFVDLTKRIDASEILRNNLLNRLGSTTRQWKTAWAEGDPAGRGAFDSGLSALMVVLKKDATRPAHAYALCTVRNLLRDWETVNGIDTLVLDTPRWSGLIADLENAPLSERAKSISQNPNLCD